MDTYKARARCKLCGRGVVVEYTLGISPSDEFKCIDCILRLPKQEKDNDSKIESCAAIATESLRNQAADNSEIEDCDLKWWQK